MKVSRHCQMHLQNLAKGGGLLNQMKRSLTYDKQAFLMQLKSKQTGAYLFGLNGHLIVRATLLKVQKSNTLCWLILLICQK